MSVQTLIFDVDGVLVEPWGFANYLKREYPAIAPQTAEFFRGIFADCLVGKADLREVLPPYLAKWGWPHSLDEYLRLWFEMERAVDARLLAAIAQARRAGFRCYVATNQERHRVAYMLTHMGFGEQFDGLYSSAHLGFTKPDARFFAAITTELDIPADQIVFWDDSAANVKAARKHGWQAEVYTDYAHFVPQFQAVTGIDVYTI